MSEKLFFRLYWRPYILLGVSFLLVFISSLAPSVLPHAWLDKHIPGYYFYMFKTTAWLVKIALAVYLLAIIRALTADYFPRLEKICTEKRTAQVTGYKRTWDRGGQLRPILEYGEGEKTYRCAINEAKGRRRKSGDSIDAGYAVGSKKKIICNAAEPRLFYIPGEEIYSRKAAMARFVLFSLLFFVELYMGILHYALS